MRTDTATSYLMSDNTVKTVITEAPVRYRDAQGDWRRVDATLVPGNEIGVFESASTSVTASFDTQAPGKPPVTLEGEGFSIGVNMLGVVEDAKLVSGDTARYLADVSRGVMLEYRALDAGIKQTVILADADAPTEFEFTVALDGIELREIPGAGYGFFKPGESEMLFELGALSVSDSAGGQYSPDHAVCEDATMTVESVDADTAKISYEVSPKWLSDPARVFPVMVDPSIGLPTHDTWIHEGSPSYGGWGADGWMNVGASSGKQLWSLVRFNWDEDVLPSDAKVLSANLGLYQFAVTGTNSSITRCTANKLYYSTTSWNAFHYQNDPPTTTWSTVSYHNSAGQWVDLDVANIVSHWLVDDPVNMGFVFKGATTGTNYRQFRTKEHTDATQRPKLEVVWAPQPVTNLTSTSTAHDGWFREVDRDDDGYADTPNDRPDQGRGHVDLSWSASSLADGYSILLYDGAQYRKVGQTVGADATSWSSEGAGIYPLDSEYFYEDENSWEANPFRRAESPRRGSGDETTLKDTIDLPSDGGAGVVVTDGSHLYYRAWGSQGGPVQWKRVGTGLNGSVSTTMTAIGPGFTGEPIHSAFVLDGFIYNGFANTANSIEGIAVSASAGDTSTISALEFKTDQGSAAPLLDRVSGEELTSGSTSSDPKVLLAATSEAIYSVAQDWDKSGGGSFDGFKVREYDRAGGLQDDHIVATESHVTDSVMADGNSLYFVGHDDNDAAIVTKVSTHTWTVIGQWRPGWEASGEVGGCYDEANNAFWMGAKNQGKIHRYEGPGLDLRDDPNLLYTKVGDEYYDDRSNYVFRVAPYSDAGEGQIPDYDNPYTIPQTFDTRTVRVNDDPRHTTYELGEMDRHDASVTLDEGTLELDVTDLEIGTWGPSAALTRHYSSGDTTATAFAPGWHFNFESSLSVSGSLALYTDEAGETHRFTKNPDTDQWEAPNGAYDKLDPKLLGGWKITRKDRSVIEFDGDGRLRSETDANGNATTYTWSANDTHLSIEAANDQSIEAEFNGYGDILEATYSTADGVRKVEYGNGGGYQSGTMTSVRWFVDEEDFSPQIAFYTYVRDWGDNVLRLEEISEPRFNPAGLYGANWTFVYDDDADRLAEVRWPGYGEDWQSGQTTLRRSEFDYSTTESTATVTSYAQVNGAAATGVEQLYEWNPTGTEAWHSNKRTVGTAALEKWSYSYNPQNENTEETTPEQITTRRIFDSRGNVIFDFDGKGAMTRNVYDEHDQVIRSTSPLGSTTYTTYDAHGNVDSEEKQLTSSQRSRTEYDHDSHGRMTLQRSRIDADADTWAVTDYDEGGYADNGEPLTVIERDVVLASGAEPVDLTATKDYDEFGNLIWEKNALGDWVQKDNVYELSGRLAASTDASGVVTQQRYDHLGFVTESWREKGAGWADRKTMVNTASGQVYSETTYDEVNGQAVEVATVTHAFDESGNEISVEAPSGTTSAAYDANGQVTSVAESGVEASTTIGYNADGQETSVTPAGNAEPDVTTYDDNGEVASEDPSDADATEYEYDAEGNETSTSEPTEAGPPVVSESFYDLGGRQTKSTDAKGFVTTFAYDELGRQTSATTGDASATKTYNTLGWVLSETDLDGQVKAYEYDEAGRVVEATLSGKTTTTTYDACGRVLERTNPDCSSVSYSHDDFGRVTRELHARGGSELAETVSSYDALGRVSESTRTIESTSAVATGNEWTADALTATTRTLAGVASRTEFASGRETGTVATRSGETTQVTRSVTATDSAGRVTGISLDAGSALSQAFAFDGAGKLIASDGLGLGSGGIDYTYSEATARQVTEDIDLAYPGGAGDIEREFGYDAAGRLTTATVTGGPVHTFAYTDDGRITGNSGRAYTYRAAEGETQRVETMVAGSVTTTYAFDERGRRVGRSSAEESATYTYDEADRMIGFARDEGADGSVETSAAYAYDASGQRTRSLVERDGVATDTRWVYEGLTLLQSVSVTDGQLTTVDYLTDSAGRPYAAWVSVPGHSQVELVWFVVNARGDVLGLTTADGTPLSHRTYSPYGETMASGSRAVGSIDTTTAAAIDSAIGLRFAGYAYDEESGLYYCSARYYDPVTCQFITKDPARADGEESAYQYCGGDPVGSTDGSGTESALTRWITQNPPNTAELRMREKYGELSWSTRTVAAGVATSAQLAIFGSLKDGRQGNAFRHAYWNALMVKRFILPPHGMSKKAAKKRARLYANAHEKTVGHYGTLVFIQDVWSKMDRKNNKIGRRMGAKYWWLSDWALSVTVLNADRDGRLWMVTHKKPRKLVRTKPW